MAEITIESLIKELADANLANDKLNQLLKAAEAQTEKELANAELVIADLKDKLEKSESNTESLGFAVVKDTKKRDVEVLNANFFLPKRGEITLSILKKEPELVSKLLAMNSENVRLK